jgi:hypothetical protein
MYTHINDLRTREHGSHTLAQCPTSFSEAGTLVVELAMASVSDCSRNSESERLNDEIAASMFLSALWMVLKVS